MESAYADWIVEKWAAAFPEDAPPAPPPDFLYPLELEEG